MPRTRAGYVDRLRVEVLPPREGQHALGQGGAALAPWTALSSSALRFVGSSRQALAQQFEAAEDHHQQVVEIVGDAAGELADRLHLLRLAECGLGAPARGHVEKAADNADELPARVPFDLLGDSGVQHLAGFRNEPVFRVPQLAERKHRGQSTFVRLPADASVMNSVKRGPFASSRR